MLLISGHSEFETGLLRSFAFLTQVIHYLTAVKNL